MKMGYDSHHPMKALAHTNDVVVFPTSASPLLGVTCDRKQSEVANVVPGFINANALLSYSSPNVYRQRTVSVFANVGGVCYSTLLQDRACVYPEKAGNFVRLTNKTVINSLAVDTVLWIVKKSDRVYPRLSATQFPSVIPLRLSVDRR